MDGRQCYNNEWEKEMKLGGEIFINQKTRYVFFPRLTCHLNRIGQDTPKCILMYFFLNFDRTQCYRVELPHPKFHTQHDFFTVHNYGCFNQTGAGLSGYISAYNDEC